MSVVAKKKVTSVGRVSYPKLVSPETNDKGEKKWSITLLFDKTDPWLKVVKAEYDALVKTKYPKGVPSTFKNPFRDGDSDRPEDEAYKGKIFIAFRAAEARRPMIVGPNPANGEIDPASVYAGSYAKVSYGMYLFDKEGGKGVGFGLNNVQLVRDGERLDSRTSAEDDFEAIEEAEDANLFG